MQTSQENVRFVDHGNPQDHAESLTPRQRELLDRINQKVAARASLEDVLTYVFETTREISPCDRIGLALLENDGRRIVARTAIATYEPLQLREGYAEDLQSGTLPTVLSKRQPRLINDLETYLQDHPRSASTKLLVKEGVRSSMTCPLFVDDRVVGVLFRSARKPAAYDDHQVLLHQFVAERVSQAVEKTIRIEQLDAANRAYFGTLAFVTHELKSPVASLMTDASLLRDGFFGDLDPKQRERVERMIAKGNYLLNLVKEYLDLSRIEGGGLEPAFKSVNLRTDVIDPALDLVREQIEARNIHLEIQSDDRINAELDPELFKIVVTNLLSNGVKYGNEAGQLKLQAHRTPDTLHLAVWNEGPGIPPDQRDRLFRKFSRIQTPELLQRKGTGIGLYTSWRIVRAHGGRIWADSEPGTWAQFNIEIPQPPAPPAAP